MTSTDLRALCVGVHEGLLGSRQPTCISFSYPDTNPCTNTSAHILKQFSRNEIQGIGWRMEAETETE